MAARNPWQKLKDEALKVRTPTQVLEQQAEFLKDATGGVIRGQVDVDAVGAGRSRIKFAVYVPTLNNYSVGLLEVVHPASQYPARLNSDWVKTQAAAYGNHEELETAVVECLETPELQKLIIGLFAQTGRAGS